MFLYGREVLAIFRYTDRFILKGAKETIDFGKKLGALIAKGDIIALSGDLGSGKTTLTKGIARGVGVKDSDRVNSPSFVILKTYKGKIPLYHFDVYRLADPADLDTVGYQDFFYGEGVSVIEWADKIRELLPENYLDVEFSIKSEDEREITLGAHGDRYESILKRLRS